MTDSRMLVPLYAAVLFLGSLLLFGLQPMVTKMVLPRLGGSPAVWNTAQVFFQLLLLAGYVYAHLLSRHLGGRVRLGVHLTMLCSALVLMPVAIASGWQPPLTTSPIPSLLGVLVVSVGLPFFAVATTAPLMQSWFAETVHASASDPYFLYSASNLGGLVALLGYPFLFEPSFGLARQSTLWAGGFGLLIVLIATAGFLLPWRAPAYAAAPGGRERPGAAKVVSWRARGRWLLLAFAPSSLMLGVTLHISTDIAASPVLWVVPLALYILSFVVCFARRPVLPHRWMLAAQPILIALLVILFDSDNLVLSFVLHLGAFFVTAMVCHGELARSRPSVEHLTEFYIWLSLGGVLGGAFSGVVAPLLFDSIIEYPLALVLACALRSGTAGGALKERLRDLALPAGLALLYFLASVGLARGTGALNDIGRLMLVFLVCLLVYGFRARVVRFSLVIVLLLVSARADLGPGSVLAQQRSFFGVSRVIADGSGRFHLLTHGGTVHAAESMNPLTFREPLTYYTRAGPAGQIFSVLRALKPEASIGAIGLGAGAITCFLGRGQSLIYYEIDPVVVGFATNTRHFGYLHACGKNVRIELGDGRRSLDAVPKDAFDLLVLDAFSSDAVPAHLLTREAMDLYLRSLAPGGILLAHISNRHLNITPVFAALAEDAGLSARVQIHNPVGADARGGYRWPSTWVLLGRAGEDLAPYEKAGIWRVLDNAEGARLWTDDYSDVVGAMRWKTLW